LIFFIILKEIFDVNQQILKICFFFLFLFSFKYTLCFCNILYFRYLFLFFEAIPLYDFSYSSDRGEIKIIHVCMMTDSDEWLMNISIWKTFHIYRGLVGLFQLFIKYFYIVIKEYCWYNSKWKISLNILIGFIVSIHAYIC